MNPEKFYNYIGDQWIPADSGEILPKYSPFDGSLLGEVASSGAMDVIKALQFAKKSLVQQEKSTLAERAQLLSNIAAELEKKADEIAFAEALHQGLLKNFVRKNSVDVAIRAFRQASQDCLDFEAQNGKSQPVGLVAIITPWCLSLRLVSERLAPAMAAGNAVLVKVSELSPITAKILVEALQAASCPAGLVQFIHGSGAQVGGVLAGHPSIRAITFVGELSRGESLIKAGSAQLKKMQLSFGAKNSSLVLADVDYQNKMPEIMESFLQGQGQMCWNTSRLFILESISKDFIESLKTYLAGLTPAQSPEDLSPWTPMILGDAKNQTVQKTQAAQQEHAKIIFGGEADSSTKGFFAKPTWTLDLTNCSVLQQDELHVPLFILTPVKYQHEMVKWSNTGYYGQSAVIWGNEEKAQKIAAQLQCASVSVNGWMKDQGPAAGHKQSSFGVMDFRSFGAFYSDIKVVK